ncbi:4-hydroxy-tetrahydrodipicolinate synthase [Tessaracoccus lubricantis]|uniref:4-hydroxy-tetrahydrodipicolinate synthase n=1 Tax=Tessaracoccus lubricantis TaxID=545543 RepID=A0ABP9F1K4_9ACTN
MVVPEVLSALTVPFTDAGEVNFEALRENLERIEPLVDGVFAAGTTGEFPSLSFDEHGRIVESTLDVFGPERVVVHVGAPSTRQSLELTHSARSLGATRFAAITPYYLPASVDGITRHWGAIKQACDGELYGYIYPDVAVTDLLPQDLPAVLASGIDGLKVSASASARVDEYLAAAPDGIKLWSGNDADLPHVMAAGGNGTVSGVSGACPEPWAAFREAYRASDEAAVAAAQQQIELIVPLLGPSIANLKYALSLQGLDGGACRMSIDQPSDDTKRAITEALRAIGLLQGS